MSPAFGLAACLLLAAGSEAAPPGAQGGAPPDTTREFAIPEVIVEAPRPAGRGLPYPETSLDPARWRAYPAKDLSDLVETAPAAHVRRSGGPGSPSFLSLRGAPPEGVLVLLDGERLNAAQGGGVDLSQVPLSGISRVEVLRGGASLLYGASALGGVVQIVSAPSVPRDESEVALEGGSLGTYAGSASLTRAFRGGWVRALGRSFHTGGSFLYERPGGGGEVVRLNSGGSAHLLDARGEARTGIGALRAALRSSRSDGGSPGLAEFPTPEARREEARDAAQLRLQRRASEISVGWARSERTYSDPADPLGAFEARHLATAASLRATARERWGAVAYEGGIDARHETLQSTTDGDRARRTGAAFGVVSVDWLARTTWTLGARWEATTSFAPEPSAGVGVAWEASAVTARAVAGTSYRPPTFDDLFWPATGMAVGNPNLRPERASDWDVGVDLRPRRLLPRVSIDAYGRDVRDLIVWNPGPSGIWRPSNVGRADVRGVEASLVWNEAAGGSLPLVEIAATLQRARDRSGEPNTDGRDLPGRARRLFAARLEKALGPRVRIETTWRAVGDVPRTAANTKSIPGYVIGSAGARVAALTWLTASAGVDNIGDVAYEDFHDFPLPGRVFRVAFAFRRAEAEPVDAGSEAGQ